MALFGLVCLLAAFAASVLSVLFLALGRIGTRGGRTHAGWALTWGGHVASLVAAVALTVCCALLVYCFMSGDTSIEYVVQYRSDASGPLAWLYLLSGLWGGRQGSLLFWAWLISVFNVVVAARNHKDPRRLDSMALMVSQLVLAAFAGVLLFSESNMPFVAMDASYFDADGNLTGAAAMWGMNTLLEHWAMAIHPPTLFIGYAGLTIPFAYAIAALIEGDPSDTWVRRSTGYAVLSWLFLGAGIGLGAVWAYVVLGWGGYWAWDPVENASLLPWLIGLALIHSFTVYRKRGTFKRWSVMCACITFAFVVLGTFITRSGLVDSVHAFAGDNVSLVLFLALIVASVLAGAVGLALRWKRFGSDGEEVDSMASRDAAYYVNNLVMVVVAVLIAYLTLAPALPAPLPFAGAKFSAGTYEAIARPLGILYCLLVAVCPLLSWGRTEGRAFWRRARVPGLCALVLFAALMAFFCTSLLPAYNATMAAGGSAAAELAEYGPSWYYHGLAVLGLFVASLLVFTSLFSLVRMKGLRAGGLRRRLSAVGGFVAHLSMGVILVGLIGSAMYTTEQVGYLPYDEATDSVEGDFTVGEYTLVYTGNSVEEQANGDDVLYTVFLDVYKDGAQLGSVAPAVQVVQSTMQQKLVASVITLPQEDLFVVFQGFNSQGALSLDVRVNPLILCVWIGFALMMAGAAIALFARRDGGRKLSAEGAGGNGAERAGGAEGAEGAEDAGDAGCGSAEPAGISDDNAGSVGAKGVAAKEGDGNCG